MYNNCRLGKKSPGNFGAKNVAVRIILIVAFCWSAEFLERAKTTLIERNSGDPDECCTKFGAKLQICLDCLAVYSISVLLTVLSTVTFVFMQTCKISPHRLRTTQIGCGLASCYTCGTYSVVCLCWSKTVFDPLKNGEANRDLRCGCRFGAGTPRY